MKVERLKGEKGGVIGGADIPIYLQSLAPGRYS